MDEQSESDERKREEEINRHKNGQRGREIEGVEGSSELQIAECQGFYTFSVFMLYRMPANSILPPKMTYFSLDLPR